MSVSRYVLIQIGFAVLAIVAAMGLLLTWPWVFAENYRLAPWELALTWSAEVAAVVWFVYMWVRLAWTWELDSAFTDRTAHERMTQWLAILVLLVGVVDLTATFLLKDYENARREKSLSGTCRITRTKIYSVKHGRYFTAFAWCEIVGDGDTRHRAYYYGPQSRYPQEVHEAILRNRLPVDMRVQYDPERPQRFWTPYSTVGEWNGWRFSQEITACAMIVALLALITRHFLVFVTLPVEICPLLGVAVRLMGAGFYMYVKGQTAIPPL
jgi:hypothetical protein